MWTKSTRTIDISAMDFATTLNCEPDEVENRLKQCNVTYKLDKVGRFCVDPSVCGFSGNDPSEVVSVVIHEPWVKLLIKFELWRFTNGNKNEISNPVIIEWAHRTVWELISYLGFGFAIIWMFMCLIFDLSDYVASDFFWFQRSGALLVLAATVAEFCQFDRPSLSDELSHGVGKTALMSLWQRSVKIAGIIAIVAGTVIWAYGDLPFKSFL